MAASRLAATLRRRIGERIRAVREEVASESLTRVALLSEVGKSTLSRWETGVTTPSLANLFKLARELGVQAMDLLAVETSDPRVRANDAIRRGDDVELTAALRALGWPVADGAIPPPKWKARKRVRG